MATTHAGSQVFQRAKLKLLDCALRPAKFLSDVSDGFLFDESFEDDGPLIFRKTVNKLKQGCATFNVAPTRMVEVLSQFRGHRLLRSAAAIDDGVRCNPEQPYRKGRSAP